MIAFNIFDMEKTVLCYIEKNNQYLMLLRNKKKIDINKNKYIGVGGHIEKGETPEQALLREVKEETGLTLKSYSFRGKIFFSCDGYIQVIFLYTSNDFSGNIIECVEGELSWICKENLFSLPLWEGDIIFLKKLLNNEKYFEIELIYKNDKLIKTKIIK